MLRDRPKSPPLEALPVLIDALRGKVDKPLYVEHVAEDVLSYGCSQFEGTYESAAVPAWTNEQAASFLEKVAVGKHAAGAFDWKALVKVLIEQLLPLILKLLG